MDTYARRVPAYLGLLASIVVIGVIGFVMLEGFSPFDAFYFTIVTIATVGYGDMYPVTVWGKLLVLAIIVTGVGCFLGLAAHVVEHVTGRQERGRRKEKTGMLVGLFFSRLGDPLLAICARLDPGRDEISRILAENGVAGAPVQARLAAALAERTYTLDCRDIDLAGLRDLLGEKIDILTLLLQNPDLDQHSRFTELLRALLHLWQELAHRGDLCALPGSDLSHLSGDLNRVYGLLLREWIVYLDHLRAHYPYLYSLAVRTNPFDEKASVIVRD